MGADVLNERPVEAVAAEGLCIADNDEFHTRACHGDVHASQVAQEANLSLRIVAHEADDYHVALLPLEAVDGADGDVALETAEVVLHFEQAAYEARLTAVGRDDAKVHALALNLLRRNHLDIVAQRMYHQPRFLGIGDGACAGSFLRLL